MADEKEEKQPDESVDLTKLFPAEKPAEEKAESETAEKDVKEKKPASSAEAEDDDDSGEEKLRDKVEALQKELARVRKNKNESGEEVQGLRESLARVQGQLETLVRAGEQKSDSAKLSKYTEPQLVEGQTQWEDELLDARDALREARKEDNKQAIAEASRQVAIAKNTLSAIRQELLDRTKRVGADQAKAQSEANKIVEEVVEMYDKAYESFPDLKDKDSEIWQAGNEEYLARPSLMKQLGPLGELVAVALAITTNPELVGGKKQAKAARKELLSEINDKAESALLKGGGKTKSKSSTNFADMGGDDFDRIVHKIKMGG